MNKQVEVNEQLMQVAMEIILHAGDAKLKITEALKCAKQFDFDDASIQMQEANEAITAAHRSQTQVIQKEADGKPYQMTLLFAHAQDTLMTIYSEYRMADEMIQILKIIATK